MNEPLYLVSLFLSPATKLGQGNIFRSMCQEFCQWGGGLVSQHGLQVFRPTPGGRLRGLAGGVSRPTSSGEAEGSGQGDLQVHTRGGGKLRGLAGGSPGPHPGGEVEGSGWGGLQAHTWGGSRPTPGGGLQAHTWGCVSQHALRQTPPFPSRRLLLRAVRILLECILVNVYKWYSKHLLFHTSAFKIH